MSERAPNILFIFSDQHSSKFTGYAGHPFVRTPNLDTLAQRGVRFENTYTPNPICVPARYCMLSGLYARDTCVYNNSDVPAAGLPSFARYLGENGWRTCLIGKAHFTGEDQYRGYAERPYGDFLGIGHQTDPYRGADPELEGPGGCGNHPVGGSWKLAGPSGIPEFQTAEHIVTHEAVKWLQIHRSTDRNTPFLLSVHYPKPHFPWQPPARWFEAYRDVTRGVVRAPTADEMKDRLPAHRKAWEVYQGYGPTQDEVDRTLAGYCGNVSYMDECLGHLLASVEHLGYGDDTLIVYSTDHGEMAGAHGLWHKQLFYEESARVPLIFAGPGAVRGETRDQLSSLIDLFPTFCDIAGLPTPDHCVGRSLHPLLERSGEWPERTVFSDIAWGQWDGCMARRGPWKYCWYPIGGEELYDLSADPNEDRNLEGEPRVADIQAELKHELMDFWRPEELEARKKSLPRVRGKGNAHDVALQHCLPDGTWADAWP